MMLRIVVFALMLLGLPVFWLLDLPGYLYFLSLLCFVIVVQSVVGLLKTKLNFWWAQILFFSVATGVALYCAML